jgi:hypothetical protein
MGGKGGRGREVAVIQSLNLIFQKILVKIIP